MKITKLSIGKGQTKEFDNRWEKVFFEITCELEFEDEEDAGKDRALAIINRWLKEATTQTDDKRSSQITPIEKHQPPSTRQRRDIEKALTDESSTVLIVEAHDHWNVKPKLWLGRDRFMGIAEQLKPYGAKYVSAGKDSHWEINK